ncbi:hypothetical protein TL16_g02094 [Triparma laevis f. inornata]|uniref:Uncharacterized protein n=2 Tax=Triparma laevis TaxID=1534972 RepID=A0A9W7FIZ9_9STRA|nr:hypothetical protein TL16_g02094 [Triparma laevis f. inornata]GMI13063.1 hypothetical protein TrLO_g3114 [Triparma laevis f. longispina]
MHCTTLRLSLGLVALYGIVASLGIVTFANPNPTPTTPQFPVVRQPTHYKDRTKSTTQVAHTLASLPAPPSSTKHIVASSLSSRFADPDSSFWQSLESFCYDRHFGLGLNKNDTEEFLKVFKKEHRNKVKSLTIDDMETFLVQRQMFNADNKK